MAMETITETIITESTMIGHNPQTPGGGRWRGRLSPRAAGDAAGGAVCRGWIVLIDDAVDFLDAVVAQ